MRTTDEPLADVDVVATVAGRRGAARREIADTVARVRDAYFETARDRQLGRKLDAFLDLVVGQGPDGRRQDGRLFFVTGESGAGKTRAIRYWAERSVALAPIVTADRTFRPLIHVKGPSPSTLQRLGVRLCREVGYPVKLDLPENRVWELLRSQVRRFGVLVVHIDEAQHLVRHMKSDHERTALANTLKDMVENPEWPVSFILSGIPVTTELARLDKQIARRELTYYCQSLDLAVAADRKVVFDLCRFLAADTAGRDVDALLTDDLVGRLAHSADYQLGRVAQVVAAAVHVALVREEIVLTVGHFADAYRASSHATGLDALNPFVAPHWRDLAPGTFVIDPEADGSEA